MPLAAQERRPATGWIRSDGSPSLPEAFRSVPVATGLGMGKRLLAFAGPGYLVAVGYMDPGNWATDLGAGSRFGYSLLSVVLLSNFVAMFLQALCAKLGIVAGRDLAQACRDACPPPVAWVLWVLCEVAIAACDLAEVLGSAVALNLLFGLPIIAGVVVTVADVLLILFLQGRGFRRVEAMVVVLILTIGICFALLLARANPSWKSVFEGLAPDLGLVTDKARLYLAIGILGATVMPHNLYLHSSLVQTRDFGSSQEEKKEALRFATIDSTVALFFAFFINGAILVLAAAAFHAQGRAVTEIQDAYRLLSPVLGVSAASVLFAVALLASGQNSTLTGTLAGQIVMEGFLNLRMRPWARRLVTRLVAVVPAVVVISLYGEKKVTDLLVFSQVVLSFQLPFAIFPLVRFTSDKAKMGPFANGPAAQVIGYSLATLVTVANGWLVWQILKG